MKKRWTVEEEKMLSKIHHLYTNAELAEIFEVSLQSICSKKAALGLRKEKEEDEVKHGYKKCYSCNTILPVSEFNKKTESKDGLQDMCRTCKREYERKVKIGLKNKNEDIERENKIKKYIAKRQGQILFCEVCNKEKKIDDYYIFVRKDGIVKRECIKCKERKRLEQTIKRMIKRGY